MEEFDPKIIEPGAKPVLCTTKGEATMLLSWADSKGLKWCSGASYLGTIQWSDPNVLYFLDEGTYSDFPGSHDYTTFAEALLTDGNTLRGELRGKVLLIPDGIGTHLVAITSQTKIHYDTDYIHIEDYSISFSQELLDSIITILNDDVSVIEQALTETS